LQCQDSVRLQQNLESFDKIVELRYLRQHVIPEDEVGGLSLCDQGSGQFGAKKSNRGWYALFNGYGCDISRGLNSKHRNAFVHEVLQQISVVARHLDHEALLVEREARLHGSTIF